MPTINADQTVLEPAPRFTSEPPKITLASAQLFVTWLARQPSVPAELTNAARAWCWIGEVMAFRAGEEQLMLDDRYDATLPDHRVTLSNLIATGEGIVRAVQHSGMATGIGFTLEDVQATVNSLHTTFRCEHGPRNSQKTNELIAQLFHGAES